MYIPASGSSVWTAITDGFRLTDSASQDICDIIHTGGLTSFKGADASADDLFIYANRTDSYSMLKLYGGGSIYAYVQSASEFSIYGGSTKYFIMDTGSSCYLGIKECSSSPSNQSGVGQLYTKSDNELYFKDGDGTEYTIDKT